jgi:PAS domain S-box-containing protein
VANVAVAAGSVNGSIGPADRRGPRAVVQDDFFIAFLLFEAAWCRLVYPVCVLVTGVDTAALFRGIVEAAPDAILVVGADGRIVLANPRTEVMFGYPVGELAGQQIEVLIPHKHREAHVGYRAEYGESPATREMALHADLYGLRRGGVEFPIDVSLAPLRTDEGMMTLVSVHDATHRKQIEAQTQQLRDDIIATVSHELRTPLTSIIGYAEVLDDFGEEDVSGQARSMVNAIQRNAQRELRLVDDLLTMAFLDDARLRVTLTPLDLAEVVAQVVADAQLQARGADLSLHMACHGPAPIRGDRTRLAQVVDNLIANCMKFTPAKGRIEVMVTREADTAVLEVRDNGVGIAAEDLPKLFDRLYRSASAIASQTPGAGLGLPIVQKIVAAHDGQVEVDSELGRGTVVRVLIPTC